MSISTSIAPSVRFRAVDRVVHYAGNEMCLYRDVVTGSSEVLPSITGELLDRCASFRTLEEHATSILQDPPFDELPKESVIQLLEQLAVAGLLPSHEQTVQQLLRTPTREAGCTIGAVGILTHNRPESLERLVSGCAANAARHGRTPTIVVADDSDSEAFQRATLDTLQSSSKRHQIAVRYIGERHKRAFAQALAEESGHPVELALFAMLAPSGWAPAPGANRNALLLDRAGEALLMLDDDVQYQTARIPGMRSHLTLSSTPDPTQYWFYRDEIEAIENARLVDEDLIGTHEQLVGRSITDVLLGFGAETADLDSMSGDFLRRAASCGGSVAFTMAGVLGDSGWRESIPYFFTEGESLRRLLDPRADYRDAMASRQILRGVTNVTVTDGEACFGFNLGIDNRQLVPPFQTACRNEDGTFGVMVHRCVPRSFSGYLPLALRHSPIPPRRYDVADMFKHVGLFEAADILPAIIQSWPGVACHVSAERGLTSLGAFLGDVGTLPDGDFTQLVRELWWARLSSEITYLERQIEDGSQDLPATWRCDLQRVAHAGQKLLMRRTTPSLRELTGPKSASIKMFRSYIANFGRLLVAWPDLMGAARRLRAHGLSLSEAL